MARLEEVQFDTKTEVNDLSLAAVARRHSWLIALGAVLVTLLVSLAIWGSNMDFPTRVSSTDIQTSSGNVVTLDRTVREVTGDTIDNVVTWITREGSWLFDGLSTGVTYALVWIENGLKWLPWPAVILGLALLSFAVGRWSLLAFTTVALLFVGFMGLWENTVDTIALMVVAVAIAIAVGLPLGILGARSRMADNLMRPILDAMQTMPSFVYLLPRDPLLRPGQARGHLRDHNLRGAAGHSPDEPGNPAGLIRSRRSGALFRDDAVSASHEGADTHGAAHHHGGNQPDDHDGAGDGDHRQHGRGRRSWRQRAARAPKEPAWKRCDCRNRNRVSCYSN